MLPPPSGSAVGHRSRKQNLVSVFYDLDETKIVDSHIVRIQNKLSSANVDANDDEENMPCPELYLSSFSFLS